MDITTFADFNKINSNKYTIPQLKRIGETFCVKWKSKKKKEIQEECLLFLKQGYYVSKIQRLWKKYMIYLFNQTQGPALFKRESCNNVDDFLTCESMKEIDYYFFISFRDIDGFVYGFNIISLSNLIKKKDFKNPYTRNIFSPELILMVEQRLIYNKILNKIYHEDKERKLSIHDKINEIFQKIDSLGNYSQSEWLTNLNNNQMRKFVCELYDIWNYRAQIMNDVKILICPPNGTPFRDIPVHIIGSSMYIESSNLKKYCFMIIDNMVNRAVLPANQNLGAIYVLTALTLVNSEAANALPWLFQSVI